MFNGPTEPLQDQAQANHDLVFAMVPNLYYSKTRSDIVFEQCCAEALAQGANLLE